MSDTRQEAAEEMVAAGLQSGMEDSLGASLSSSFAPPSTAHSHKPATETGTTQASGTVAVEAEAESTPVPGMDEWKSVLEEYNVEWIKEADVARAKAERNRKFYEDEAEAKAKAAKDEEALKKRREREEKRAEEGRERLRRELAGEVKPKKGAKEEGRDNKVKEAWEMVKASEGQEGKPKEVVTDGRGVMPQDIRAGMAHAEGEPRHHISQTMYDPTTSTEPLPPSMQDAPPARGPTSHPSESQAASRHSATSGAWETLSGAESSAEDISPASSAGTGSGFSSSPGVSQGGVQPTPIAAGTGSYANLPTTSTSHPGQALTQSGPSGSGPSPPTQPPSLTLSLFTSPANLSVSRVIAVLGINLVLPFINGVMLGFGEIFARETVRFGRLVWRGERALFGRSGWGGAEEGQARGGGRGVAGVGLSGSGGFP